MDGDDARVTVSVRVRPKLAGAVNALQQSERYEEVVCVPTSDTTLRLAERRAAKVNREMHFAYDHVFDMDATQADVYEAAALDGVDRVLGGTNASLLTYGQTGSGKTYTVLGKVAQSTESTTATTEVVGEDSGLLLRAIQDMLSFAERMQHKKQRHVVLGITAIEIYNDEIRDLLREGVAAAPLQPIMTREALHFPGLTHRPLRSLGDACAVYERAAARRVQRATSANDTSSRSHAVFTVEVFQAAITADCSTPPTLRECCALRDAAATTSAVWSARPSAKCGGGAFDGAPNVLFTAQGFPVMYSALTVADLAGSEKAKHADVQGAGFEELRRINASLTALGNVVHHLYHASSHVPYRDSKLTMVLRDTFAAPRARVVLFVNVSPTAVTCEETLSSLYFADKMKGMSVPDNAASPQQAALQSSYLASLRVHDALLAELHIFHAQQELSTGLLHRVVSATSTDHPLLQLPFHTALGEGAGKAQRLRELCTQLKAAAALSESPEARTHRLVEAERRETRKAALMAYSQRRAETHARIAEATQSFDGLTSNLAEARVAMHRTFDNERAAAQSAKATHQALSKSKAAHVARLAEMDSAIAAASTQSSHNEYPSAAEDAVSASVTDAASDDTRVDETLGKAMELAQLRLTFLELVAFHVRTSPPPQTPADDCDGSDVASRSAKSRSRSGTASSHAKPATTEEWVRGAVLAMANNAVVLSAKRQAKRQGSGSRPVLGDVTNVLPTTSQKAQQLPKYWKLLQEKEGSPETAGEGEKEGATGAVQEKRGFRSSFDDPALFTRVAAYMDMGAALVKLDRAGHPRPRWFYLAQRESRMMLCWDESRRRGSLGGGGHVYLDAVVKIVLGRSSPGFLKHAKTDNATSTRQAEGEDVCNAFTVVYHTRASHRDFKFVDVVCPDKNEMETWVVGLAHWAGVAPVYEDARQPDDAEEMARSVSADSTDAGKLDAKEAVLSRLWHIPAAVLTKTREEMAVRRRRHPSGRMRLTPGELRDLTGLDIFRASALWLHFEREGWVANPTRQLRCFVGDAKVAETSPVQEGGRD